MHRFYPFKSGITQIGWPFSHELIFSAYNENQRRVKTNFIIVVRYLIRYYLARSSLHYERQESIKANENKILITYLKQSK